MPQKKNPRKQLLKEPDEFMTVSARLLRFCLEHKLQLLFSVAGLIVLVAAFSIVRYFSNKTEDRVFTLLEENMTAYSTALNKEGPLEAYHKVEKNFQQIIDTYSGRNGERFARVIYADISYRAGNTDTAISLYQSALEDFNDNPYLTDTILKGLGYAFEKKKDYKTAATYFEKSIKNPEALMKDEALFNLGQLYAQIGEDQKSRDAFQQILSNHPDSIYFKIVKEKID